MEKQEVQEILDIFENYRKIMPYQAGGFALQRIEDAVAGGMDLAALRASEHVRLLTMPLVQAALAAHGSRWLDPSKLAISGYEDQDYFTITLGKWGCHKREWLRSYEQMARCGYNLVILLNHSGQGISQMKRISRKLEGRLRDKDSCHPRDPAGGHTIAWARVDLDLEDGVALIEEIQSDWVHAVGNIRYDCRDLQKLTDRQRARRARESNIRVNWLGYLDSPACKRLEKMWAEAMLHAAIELLVHEVGMTTVYLYGYETGNIVKGLDKSWGQPPRSLYTRLPKRYGMVPTRECPDFLLKKKDRTLRRALADQRLCFWKWVA